VLDAGVTLGDRPVRLGFRRRETALGDESGEQIGARLLEECRPLPGEVDDRAAPRQIEELSVRLFDQAGREEDLLAERVDLAVVRPRPAARFGVADRVGWVVKALFRDRRVRRR
jgi:hypothetical protein